MPKQCLEAMADEVLHTQPQHHRNEKKTKNISYQEVIHRANQLNQILDPWLASEIPEHKCKTIEAELMESKLRIDEFLRGLEVGSGSFDYVIQARWSL